MPTPSLRRQLPVNPSLEHLQKQAKRRVKQDPTLPLTTAQHQLAQEYGCKTWAELAHVVETMARGADQLVNVTKEVEPLPKAARRRDLPEIRRILESGLYTTHDLDAALGSATWYGRPETWPARKEICDLLMSYGADPDGQAGSGYGPIVFGTGECIQPEGLLYLIEAGADVSFPPVKTKYGWHCPLSFILGTYDRGNNTRKHRYLEILLPHHPFIPPEVTPPVLAIHRGDARQLSELIDREPEWLTKRIPDLPYGNMLLTGGTLLHCAVEFGENACVEALLDRGANLNAKADLVDGVGGQTPIYHAIASMCDGNFPTLQLLAARGGPALDLTVRATFKRLNHVQPRPITPLEFAEQCAPEADSHNRTKATEEIALLRSLAAQLPKN